MCFFDRMVFAAFVICLSVIGCGGDAPVVRAPTVTPVKQVAAPVETFTQLYLRGSMNNWGTGHQLERDQDGNYKIKLPLSGGRHEFKIADANWSDGYNFGAAGAYDVALGVALETDSNSSTNLAINVKKAGEFEFILKDITAFGAQMVVNQLSEAVKKKVAAKKKVKTGERAKRKECPRWDGQPIVVDVSGQFPDGTRLQDALSGEKYNVAGGKVSVVPGPDSLGFVLLERAASEPKVFSWDNASIYFMLTDRFYNGDKSNDNSYGRKPDGDLEVGTFHGGDLAGIVQKLDYIESLGINAIWITPPFEQVRGWVGGGPEGDYVHYGYHGYWIQDFTRIDQNYGDEKALETLIDEAHKRGIRVLVDVVLNHPGYSTLKDMQELEYGAVHKSSPLAKLEQWTDWKPRRRGSWHDFNEYKNKGSGKWLNWWGPDWIRDDIPRYDPEVDVNTDAQLGALAGLPDFKTESDKIVTLPEFFKNKETNAKTLPNATVKDYLIHWTTDWVRKYGIDGFRVDTVKHVGSDVWRELKIEGTKALQEWRAKHPEKVLDNRPFWMLGEIWGHGVEKSHYFDDGFDSVINFSFQGEESKSALSCFSRIDDTFADYAEKINSDDTFNVMSYLSSHDTLLYFDAYSRSSKRHRKAAASLFLLPGAVQIYYGDESGREYSETGTDVVQGTRSDMNWSEIDAGGKKDKILNFWRTFGKFRNRHVAVGAGAHVVLATSPYVFARQYNKEGVKDDVVVVYTGRKAKKAK